MIKKKKLYKDYQEFLLEKLQDPKLAIAYLNEALKDPDRSVFLIALKDVLEAQGEDMTELAKETQITRQTLYRMLSPKGNPQLNNFRALCDTLGYDVQLSPKK